jgi:hypothetical protein
MGRMGDTIVRGLSHNSHFSHAFHFSHRFHRQRLLSSTRTDKNSQKPVMLPK